ncbi:MAG TPA: glycosyltransferase [Candidatus Krumholzibacteria bacterium]|nr:glycosyltransferase [Candidatus Krumholzibacteria bacterium]
MEKRRIALVASTFGVGGAEIVTGNVLRRLPRDRYDIRLYFLHDAGPIGADLRASGLETREHLCRHRRDVAGAWRLERCLRSFRPGLVWCMDHMDAMWLGRSAALVAGVPDAIIASHSTGLLDSDGRMRPSFGRRERVLTEFVSRVVAVSATHARYLRTTSGLSPAQIAIIENGIDVSQWPVVTAERRADARSALGIDGGDAVVTMIAAMRPEKAHDVLLESVAALRREGRRVRVLMAGDGPRRGVLEEHAQHLGIRDRVEFLGIRRDVARLLHASDAVVLPSRAVVETLPLSVLETMACGIPVIASRVGSVPEVVVDGETGRLIPPGDAPALARAIVATLDDGGPARGLARNARTRVEERYRIEDTAAGYQALFDELMTH